MNIFQTLKEKNNLIIALCICIFVLVIKFLNIDYQDNDDYVYTTILSGVYSGTPSPLTVYEGYYFGLLVTSLYELLPRIEWYACVMHFLYIVSFAIIASKLLKSNVATVVKYASLVALVSFQVYLLLSPQFTILAGELALAASVLLVNAPRKREYLMAVLLIFASSQIRVSAMLMVIVPLMPLLFLPLRMKEKSWYTKPAVYFAAILVSLAVNVITNKIAYSQDEDWDFYMAYNTPRGVIEQSLQKESAVNLFKDSLKIQEYKLMCKFGLIDGHIISIDEMNACADYVKSKGSSLFVQNMMPYYYGLRNQGFGVVGICILLLICISVKRRKTADLFLLSTTFVLFLIELIYCMNTSFAKERIIICLMFFMFTATAICAYRLLSRKELQYACLVVSLFFSAYYIRKSYYWEIEVNDRLESTVEVNSLLSTIPDSKVHMLGIPGYAEIYHISKTPCRMKCIGKGWLNNNPLHKEFYSGYSTLVNGVPIIKPQGAKNDNIDCIINALFKHYQISVTTEVIAKSDNYEVVRLVEKK